MFEYILENLAYIAIIGITMRNFRTTLFNFTVNTVNSLVYKKNSIIGGVSTVYEFVKFQCYMMLINLYEKHFIKEYPTYFEVNYYFAGSPYKIIVQKKKGISGRVSKITDITTNKNITTDTFKELGPYRDFHNAIITPKILGYPDGLSIKYKKGETIIYKGCDVISCK